MCILYLYYIYMYVHITMLKYTYWRYTNWRPLEYKFQLVHEYCNRNKLYKVPDTACIGNENYRPIEYTFHMKLTSAVILNFLHNTTHYAAASFYTEYRCTAYIYSSYSSIRILGHNIL